VVGRSEAVRQQFYAISVERKIRHRQWQRFVKLPARISSSTRTLIDAPRSADERPAHPAEPSWSRCSI